MGFDDDAVVKMRFLPGEFFCGVCRSLVYPNKCMQGPCGHLYCEPCVTHITSTTFTCAHDGEMVTVADCKPLLESNKTLADAIGKVQVLCLYHKSGCTWEGSLSDCTSHCSTCSFGETEVLCSRCGIALKHRQGVEHSRTCSGVVSHVQQSGDVPQATSSQTAQVAMPTPEQMYQQQLPYQQCPGYCPYQFDYPDYYEHPQVAEIQTYPQTYGQAQSQYLAQPLVPFQGGQPPLQPQVYATVNVEYVVPSLWETQPQMQAQGQELMGPATSNPSQLLSQASQPFPLQPLQVPLYPGALPEMQYPHMEPYPQSQTQYYPYSQPNPQFQSQSHLNMPASVHSPVQFGAVHTVQPPAYYSSQIQGQYPPNQLQPGGPSVQLPAVYPQAQQPRSLSQVPPQGEVNHGQRPTAQTNVGHSYAGRPMDVQAVVNPNAEVAGPAGADQARPPHLNQSHPKKTHNQVSRAEQQTSRDNGMPLKTKNDVAISDSYHSRSQHMPDAETKMENHVKEAKPSSKVPVREGNHVKEAKPSSKVGAGEGVLKTSEDVGQKAGVKRKAYPTHSHQPAFLSQTTYQLRPQVPVGSIPLHGSSRSQGQPGDPNYHQGPFHHSGQSQFGVQKSGHYDGRRPDSHHHGPTEQNSSEPYRHGIQPGVVNFSGPSAHGPMSGPGMPNDFGKFPRPPNFEAGSLPSFGTQSSSEPLDHGLRMAGGDRMLKPFDMGPPGFDRYPSFKMDGVGSGPVGRPGENSGHGFSHHAHGGEVLPRDSHQQKVGDQAFRIKQNKKQKVSKSRFSCEEGRDGGGPKNSGFQGCGNKH